MDLPANVAFDKNPDGWSLNQKDEVIQSVQAFWDGAELNIELWGSTNLISPAGKRYEDQEFQQNVWIQLDQGHWEARRLVYDVADTSHLVRDGVEFNRQGGPDDIALARRI